MTEYGRLFACSPPRRKPKGRVVRDWLACRDEEFLRACAERRTRSRRLRITCEIRWAAK